jgi:uncharacterized tellurite resistance protein B-like protein
MGTIAQIFESGEQTAQKGHFRNLVLLARLDGVVDEAEKNLLSRIANRLGLTEEQVKEIKNNPDNYAVIPPVNVDERTERFVQLIEMSMTDAVISMEEKLVIHRMAIALGYTDETFVAAFDSITSQFKAGKSKDEILQSI